MIKAIFIALVLSLSGCAGMAKQYAERDARHPCRNIWDVCPGDNAVIDRIRFVLEGRN